MRHYYWHGCTPKRLAYGLSYASHKYSNGNHSKRPELSKRPEAWETRSHRSHGGSFGVRRPLRYLRYHLDLDESQTRRVAAILNELKLEREQARVDEKRSLHALADILTRDDSGAEHFKTALEPRVSSAERMRSEVAKALDALCKVLDPDQREEFADMVRSGQISL